MKFQYPLTQECRVTRPLGKVVIDGPMPDFPVIIIAPVLRSLGGEDRVFNREDKIASFGKATIHPSVNVFDGLDIVKSQGADHHVERCIREFDILSTSL